MLIHIERNYDMTLTAQKKKIAEEYPGSDYLGCYRGVITIMVIKGR